MINVNKESLDFLISQVNTRCDSAKNLYQNKTKFNSHDTGLLLDICDKLSELKTKINSIYNDTKIDNFSETQLMENATRVSICINNIQDCTKRINDVIEETFGAADEPSSIQNTFNKAFSLKTLKSIPKGPDINVINKIYEDYLMQSDYIQNQIRNLPSGYLSVFFLGGRHIVVIKTDTNAIDVSLMRRTIGVGNFKSASRIYSLTHGITNVLVAPHYTAVQRDGVVKPEMDIDKECAISDDLKKNFVPYVLELRKVKNYATGWPGYITEMCDKGNLQKIFSNDSTLSLKQKYALLIQTAEGLCGMHQAGYCHGDLKLDNIFVKTNSNGELEARIGDYSAALAINSPNNGGSGAHIQTAPELLDRRFTPFINSKIDVFAFGTLLHATLPHAPMIFHPQTLPSSQVIYPQLDMNTMSKLQYNLRSANTEIHTLIADCLFFDPSQRPSMKEVLARLKLIAAAIPGNSYKDFFSHFLPYFNIVKKWLKKDFCKVMVPFIKTKN